MSNSDNIIYRLDRVNSQLDSILIALKILTQVVSDLEDDLTKASKRRWWHQR